MSNELVVIEKEHALAVLSTKEGVEKLIEDVRDRVMSLEGGNLKTKTGRKNIRSNAFKATKAKTAIESEYIKPLIDSVTKKIQPELDTIQALKDNKKILDAGLDKIRKDVNAEVQAIEDEEARAEEEKRQAEEAEKLRLQVESDHEMGLLMNEKIDREAEDARIEAERVESERLAKEEAERIEREEKIRREAEEKAKADVEREKQQLVIDAAHSEALLINRDIDDAAEKIKREEDAKRQAEQEERDRIAAEEKAKLEAEQAEKRRIEEAEQAEARRLADIEKAKQAEIQRQKEEADRIEQDRLQKEADTKHAAKIHNEMMQAAIDNGVPEKEAKAFVILLAKNKIPHVGKVQY